MSQEGECAACRNPASWIYVPRLRLFQPLCGHVFKNDYRSLGGNSDRDPLLVNALPHAISPYWFSGQRLVFDGVTWECTMNADQPSSEGHPSFRDPSQRNKWTIFKRLDPIMTDTSCPVCSQTDKTLLLPCGHPLCESCASLSILSDESFVDTGRMRCPCCRAWFSLGFLSPITPELRFIRILFSSTQLRLDCKLALLHSICQILDNDDASQIMQLVDLLILLSNPPDSGTLERLRPLLGIKPNHTHLMFAWKRTRPRVHCSIK